MIPVMRAPENPTEFQRAKFDKVALVDADFIKYVVASKIEHHIKERGRHPSETMGPGYIDHFTGMVLESYFYERFEALGMLFVFSGSSRDTFRYGVGFTKEYKGNRSGKEAPYEGYYLDLARTATAVSRSCMTYVHPNYEADDIVAMLQNDRTFIYSKDKDLKQIPGSHYDPSNNTLHDISERDALYMLCEQLLIGDSTDNICGVENVGPKTAEKILEDIGGKNMLPRVMDVYMNKYGNIEGVDRFCESWMLVKMRMDRGGHASELHREAFMMRDSLLSINH